MRTDGSSPMARNESLVSLGCAWHDVIISVRIQKKEAAIDEPGQNSGAGKGASWGGAAGRPGNGLEEQQLLEEQAAGANGHGTSGAECFRSHLGSGVTLGQQEASGEYLSERASTPR